MILCPSVRFTCCNSFDELRFHKNWFHYYQPKMILTNERAKIYFEKLAEIY